ncbi:MAG: Gfo/Idh/MocA family oxidoreductase, partial [Verrucomicrobiota bacterium]
MRSSRRDFLKTAAMASAPFILPSHIWSAETQPNDRIVMGFIGMGKQNRGLAGNFRQQDGVQMVAVCDVDRTRRDAAKQKCYEYYSRYPDRGSADCAAYNDFREITERSDIDAVCIATPDHWHAVITLAALRAGKDVYCEKPLTHNIHEAVDVMKAVKVNERVLQTGSMQRSWREFRTACELVRNGVIGTISHVTCSFGGPGKPCDLPPEVLEPGLDWDRWVGPAPYRSFNSVLSPRGDHNHFPQWRRYREYGGGSVTDIGAHHLDIAQWGLGMDGSGPVEVLPPADEKAERGAVLKYENGITVTHENGWQIHFYGEHGEVKVGRRQFEMVHEGKLISRWTKREDGGSLQGAVVTAERAFLENKLVALYKSENHTSDFISAMRSRKRPVTSEIE